MFQKTYICLCLFAWSSVISQRDNNLLQSSTNYSSTSSGNLLIKTDDGIKALALNEISDLDDKTSLSQDEKRNVLTKELTGEWADILSDEEVPNEASVKIDLTTGRKMAKIAEDSGNQGKKFLVTSKNEPFSFDTLKYGLKSLKKSNKKDKRQDNENRKDYRDEKWTLKELKFEDLKQETIDDTLKTLLFHYTKSNITGKLSLLDEIEFLVHQYEVAQNFVEFGGIDILLHDIISDNESLQAMIAMTFGAAMQGNSFVQQAVLKRDAMPVFLALLRSSNSELQSRAMFAISTLIRHNPKGQSLFMSNGGLNELALLFTENKASEKLKRKAITLIYDLVSEKQIDEENAHFMSSPFATGIMSQKRKNLEALLKSHGFCHHVTSLLSSDDENVLEILIQTMSRLVYLCEREFFTNRDKLITLQEKYKVKAYAELKEQLKEKGVLSVMPELYINNLYNSLSDVILVVNDCCKDEL